MLYPLRGLRTAGDRPHLRSLPQEPGCIHLIRNRRVAMKTSNILPRLTSHPVAPSREQPQPHRDSQVRSPQTQPDAQRQSPVRALFNWLIQKPELRVWQKRDSQGVLRWYAYDPVRDRAYNTDSETDMRIWIEQRYSA